MKLTHFTYTNVCTALQGLWFRAYFQMPGADIIPVLKLYFFFVIWQHYWHETLTESLDTESNFILHTEFFKQVLEVAQ